MMGTIRRMPLFLGTLLLVFGVPAAAGGTQPDARSDCSTEQAAAEEAHKFPPNEVDDDHPSGKDRSLESSASQASSVSDPDAMTNNGPDKPGCAGGFDDDQDGNNGCGNDDDFEDDNNGWCGHPPTPEAPVPTEEENEGEIAAQGDVAPLAVASAPSPAPAPAPAAVPSPAPAPPEESPDATVDILGAQLADSALTDDALQPVKTAGLIDEGEGLGALGLQLAATGLAAAALLLGGKLISGGRVLRGLGRR
jgi:hypothetical protein